jgi:hypothetical protein
MNVAEMACCQHMSGDCDMGQGHESCCQTNSNPSVANTTLATPSVDLSIHALPVIAVMLPVSAQLHIHHILSNADDGSPPGPISHSIFALRI